MSTELILILLLPAICAGLIAGIFGLGGGVVIVPAVYYVLTQIAVAPELAMSMAIATSLLTIVVTGFSSARAHHGLGNIDKALLITWILPLAIGALIGSSLVAFLRSPLLIILFGAFLWFVAALNLISQTKKRAVSKRPVNDTNFGVKLGVTGIGFISALAGVGGGTLSVPLVKSLGRSTHQAVGTSAAAGFVLALVSSFWFVGVGLFQPNSVVGSFGLLYVPALIVILPCTTLLAPVGAKLGKRIPASILDKLFVGLLFVLGLKMILEGGSAM